MVIRKLLLMFRRCYPQSKKITNLKQIECNISMIGTCRFTKVLLFWCNAGKAVYQKYYTFLGFEYKLNIVKNNWKIRY